MADAKQRIFELELRLNARQLQKAHSDSLAGTKDSPLARGWKLTGYNDLRSTVFGSYVNSQNSSAHQVRIFWFLHLVQPLFGCSIDAFAVLPTSECRSELFR